MAFLSLAAYKIIVTRKRTRGAREQSLLLQGVKKTSLAAELYLPVFLAREFVMVVVLFVMRGVQWMQLGVVILTQGAFSLYMFRVKPLENGKV